MERREDWEGHKYMPPTHSLGERGVHELKLNSQSD